MVQTWDIHSDESVSLDELIAFFERRGPFPVSGHDLTEAAVMMRRVLNCRDSICRHIVDRFSSLVDPGVDDYTPDGVVLHRSRHFFVRIVMWLPDGMQGQRSSIVDNTIHDHNFHFLTLGLLGPGYVTEVWQYDHEPGVDMSGRTIPVRHQGTMQLSEGRVFHFARSVDIHRQLPPERFSVSLNIIESDDVTNLQYDFRQPRSGANDRLDVASLLNPPFVQQLSNMLRVSPLRDKAAAILQASPLASHTGPAGDAVRRAQRMLDLAEGGR